MRLSGAAIVRNGVKFGYPFVESIKSILPICGEFIVAVGDSEDETRQKIVAINDPKIQIIDTKWNPDARTGGEVLSQQTNLAMSKCQGEWIFYLQADEVVHEGDFEKIMAALLAAEKSPKIEGLVFDYLHFYGSYYTVQSGRNWYNQEVRIVRNGRSIKSHGDAQGFRCSGKKIKAINTGAKVYHYGWVRPPDVMMEKIKSFHRFWHDDVWIDANCKDKQAKDFFSDLGNLVPFNGTHPYVMKDVVNRNDEAFIKGCQLEYLRRRSIIEALRDFFRRLPFGRHRNFKLYG